MKHTLSPSALYWASFNRFEFRLPGECVTDCSQQGANDDAVAYWAPKVAAQVIADDFRNKPTPDSIRAELKEYGAWDSYELEDDEANWQRIVWIAAHNIAEEESPDSSNPVAPVTYPITA
jgi:hypothetical protein